MVGVFTEYVGRSPLLCSNIDPIDRVADDREVAIDSNGGSKIICYGS